MARTVAGGYRKPSCRPGTSSGGAFRDAVLCMATLALPILLAAPASAQQGERPRPEDRRELERFVDGVVRDQLERHDIPGATVSVVKDGEILLSKGYGYADVETKEPVVADETLFRPGSGTKMFTWTAVMQLVERGELDLNADVNRYLEGTGVPVPDDYPGQPVTLESLMTHSAGYENRLQGVFAGSPEDMRPLREVLAEKMPDRARPPGEATSYSNHGTALAGLVVENVSGVPFDRYVEQNILGPLGMERSTMEQPVPRGMADSMASGYASDPTRAEDFEYLQLSPAGGLTATSTDMARFMIAHLGDGSVPSSGGRILDGGTVRQMRERLFSNDPKVDGFAHGWFESSGAGTPMLWHGGDTLLFHSTMGLLPEEGVGFFACYNAPGGRTARDEFTKRFTERYYPGPGPPEPEPIRSANADRVAGIYRDVLQDRDTFFKAVGLQQIHVRAEGGEIRLGSFVPGGGELAIETEPGLFRREDKPEEYLVFREDAGGVPYAFQGGVTGAAVATLERVPWYEADTLHFGLLAFCVLAFASALVFWPIGALGRRLLRRPLRSPKPARRARLLAWAVALLGLLVIAGIVAALAGLRASYILDGGPPPVLPAALALGVVCALLTVPLVFCAYRAWRGRWWGLIGRAHYSLVALGAVGFVSFLAYWNLLGFWL